MCGRCFRLIVHHCCRRCCLAVVSEHNQARSTAFGIASECATDNSLCCHQPAGSQHMGQQCTQRRAERTKVCVQPTSRALPLPAESCCLVFHHQTPHHHQLSYEAWRWRRQGSKDCSTDPHAPGQQQQANFTCNTTTTIPAYAIQKWCKIASARKETHQIRDKQADPCSEACCTIRVEPLLHYPVVQVHLLAINIIAAAERLTLAPVVPLLQSILSSPSESGTHTDACWWFLVPQQQ